MKSYFAHWLWHFLNWFDEFFYAPVVPDRWFRRLRSNYGYTGKHPWPW